MRVRVNSDRCQGHTLCWLAAPRAFVLDDVDGHSWPTREIVAPEDEDGVAEAALSCPEQAVEVMA
jgi:ferredoxin